MVELFNDTKSLLVVGPLSVDPRERSSRSTPRADGSFRIPEGTNTDKIKASFKKGVLTVSLPKSPEVQKKENKVAVKAHEEREIVPVRLL